MRNIVLILLCSLITINVHSKTDFIHFNTNNEQLQHNTVNSIVRDNLGYVWIATNNGLNRLDGYNTTVFRNNENDSTSISANFIIDLFIDSKNTIWVGTMGGGVNIYRRETNDFVSLQSINEKFTGENITDICEDHQGNIWIGVEGQGITKFNTTTRDIETFDLEKYDPAKRTNSNVNVLYCDFDGNIWIGMTKAEIFKINPQTHAISYHGLYRNQPDFKQVGSITGITQNIDSIIFFSTWAGNLYTIQHATDTQIKLYKSPDFFKKASITGIEYDSKQNSLWFCTWQSGLMQMNCENSDLLFYMYDKSDQSSIPSNNINTIFLDQEKDKLWAGTINNGASMMKLGKKMFQTLPLMDSEGKISKNLNTYAMDHDSNTLWIGSRGSGLWAYNKKTRKSKNFLAENNHGLNSNNILSINYSTDGNLWIGTDGSFISVFDPLTETFKQIEHGTDWSDAVFAIEENNLYVWAGTWGGGIKVINKETLKYTTINFDANDQYRNTVFDLQLNDSILWIANIGIGLIRYNIHTQKQKVYSYNEQYPNFPKERILEIYLHNDSLMYLTTDGDGMYCFNVKNEHFKKIDYNEALTDNVAQSVVCDNDNGLWIATTGGLSHISANNKKITHFYKHNGLTNNLLNKGALLFDSLSNTIYVGTTSGVSYANTKKNIIDSTSNQLVFTHLYISNKLTDFKSSNISKPIDIANKVEIFSNEKTITLHFSDMDFTPSFRNAYKYKLTGFDKDWIEIDHSINFVQYTNLNPGQYTLQVITINSDGIESDKPANLKIVVHPAFWQTWLFNISIIVFILFLIVLYFRIRNKQLLKAKIKLEEKVRQRTHEIESQKQHIEKQKHDLEVANETKNKFLSIISHDLKNPVANIQEITNLIIEFYDPETDERITNLLNALHSSSAITLSLLDNLLIWARTQTDRIIIEKKPEKIEDIIQSTVEISRPIARKKNITIETVYDNSIQINIDKNSIETVLRNLLTNAIKYSHEGSKVKIQVRERRKDVVIEVVDNGTGMSETVINNIFKIDKVISKSGTSGETGTGLGLIICNEFVTLNNGKIWVTSKKDIGTTVSFSVEKA